MRVSIEDICCYPICSLSSPILGFQLSDVEVNMRKKKSVNNRGVMPLNRRKEVLSRYKKISDAEAKEKGQSATQNNQPSNKEIVDFKDLSSVYKYNKMKRNNIDTLLVENPDLELAVEILVSSITSPTDMITTNFIHKLDNTLLSHELKREIIDIQSADFTGFYGVDKKLYDWVYKAYNPGAFAFICIGDKFDNALGMDKEDGDTYSINTDDFTITRNIKKIAKHKPTLNIDTEAFGVRKKLEKIRNLISLGNIPGEHIDRPTVLEWPMESIIPVTLKNEPSNHLRYILLLDEHGFPLEETELKIDNDQEEPEMVRALKGSRVTQISTDNTRKENMKAPIPHTSELLKQTIQEKLNDMMSKEGINGFVSDKDLELIRNVMFNNTMAKNKVTMLVLDASNVAYLAYDYKRNGVGKSPLEDLTIIGGIRAMVRYTTLSAMVQNAVQFTKVKVKLDDDDRELEVRIQEAYDFIYNNRADTVPTGLLKVEDISDYLKTAGIIVEFEHDAIPAVSVDLQRMDVDKKIPDRDLDESLAKLQYMKLHISPEMVDGSKDIDYAESVKTSNVLFKRRLIRKIERTNDFLSKVSQVILSNDGLQRSNIKNAITSSIVNERKSLLKNDAVKDIVKETTDEELVEMLMLDIFDRSTVSLPSVDQAEENVNSEMFSTMVDTLDNILKEMVNEDMFPTEIIGENGDNIEAFRAMMKSSAVRRWLNENGYYKDTLKIVNTVDGKTTIPLLEEYVEYSKQIEEGVETFYKDMKKVRKKGNKALEKFNSEEDDTEPEEVVSDDNTGDVVEDKPEEQDKDTSKENDVPNEKPEDDNKDEDDPMKDFMG